MYWIAEKQDGEIIALTEREALTHFENNNIANRMRLRFLGVTDGKNTKKADQQIKDIIKQHRPDDFAQMERADQNIVDHQIRMEHSKEIKKLREEAFEKDIEDAKENGVKRPRKDLHIHTISKDGHSRKEILGGMQGMV